MSNTVFWLIVGSICVALEAFGVSGVGLFFAGLAALCVAVVVKAGLVLEDAYVMQAIWFFGLTTFWAILLWKPMKRLRFGSKGHKPYNSVVGETAVVSADGLRKGHEGQVQWSGTLMRAFIAHEETAETIEGGARVTIVEVEGNKLYVKRKE